MEQGDDTYLDGLLVRLVELRKVLEGVVEILLLILRLCRDHLLQLARLRILRRRPARLRSSEQTHNDHLFKLGVLDVGAQRADIVVKVVKRTSEWGEKVVKRLARVAGFMAGGWRASSTRGGWQWLLAGACDVTRSCPCSPPARPGRLRKKSEIRSNAVSSNSALFES